MKNLSPGAMLFIGLVNALDVNLSLVLGKTLLREETGQKVKVVQIIRAQMMAVAVDLKTKEYVRIRSISLDRHWKIVKTKAEEIEEYIMQSLGNKFAGPKTVLSMRIISEQLKIKQTSLRYHAKKLGYKCEDGMIFPTLVQYNKAQKLAAETK